MRSQPTSIVSKENVPKIELEGFKAFQMSEEVIDLSIQGKKALQYDDYEIFFDSKISRYELDETQKLPTKTSKNHAKQNLLASIESVQSPKAKRQQDLYFFPQGVTYTRNDNSSFWSETGVYDHKEQSFKGKGKFKLISNEGEINGLDIYYSHVLQRIQAQSVQADLLLDEIKKSQNENKKFPTIQGKF